MRRGVLVVSVSIINFAVNNMFNVMKTTLNT